MRRKSADLDGKAGHNMNQEKTLEVHLNSPDLLVTAGSRLYGTDTPESDYDYRGFIVPPFEYMVGLSKFDHHILREPDSVIYSIRRFFELLMGGDPVALEILYAPDRNIARISEIGTVLIRNRRIFVSKQCARRITGYAQSEWRKVTGTQLVTVERTPTEDEVVENIREIFHPDKETMDTIIYKLFMKHPKETRSAKRKLGLKRKQQIEKHGYCTSSACHTIRLLGQLAELMETGEITFPRPDARMLLSIKKGQVPLKIVTELYDIYSQRSIIAEENTSLPDKARTKDIRNLYHEIIAQSILKDVRCKEYARHDRWSQ